MPEEITERAEVHVRKENDCENPIFQSREDMNRSLSRFCYGDLHIIGSLWVEGLKAVLVGSKMCIIPTVEAAPPKDPTPKRPPKMRYKDLPLYDRPHWEYKQYLEDEQYKCLGQNPKILQSLAHPMVASWRKSITSTMCGFSCFLNEWFTEASQDVKAQWRSIKSYMRAKENYEIRAAVVAGSTTAAFLFGCKKSKLFTQRLFWTSIGALASGALCFPKETDEHFRNACHQLDKALLVLYNFWTGQAKRLPEVGPCEQDMPPIPPKRKIDKKHECPKPVAKKPPPKKPPPKK